MPMPSRGAPMMLAISVPCAIESAKSRTCCSFVRSGRGDGRRMDTHPPCISGCWGSKPCSMTAIGGTGADGGVRPGATTRASQSSEAVSGSAAAARGGATTAASSPATSTHATSAPCRARTPAPIHSTRLLPSGAKLRCNDRDLAPP